MDMTWQTITDTIEEAAKEARQASLDAHGKLVPVKDAYDFILSVWYDTEDPRYDIMPTAWIPNGFAQTYKGRAYSKYSASESI
jgi:hypothetical protein